MNSKLIIPVLAIIVVVGVAAFFILSGDNSDDNGSENTTDVKIDFKYDPSIRLAVFGNANGDDHLDSKDMDTLKGLVSGKVSFDPVKNSFADTNNDGVLN